MTDTHPELLPLRPDNTALLVIDLQDKLLPAIYESAAVIEASRKLIESAKILSLPILLTEQYPTGLGPTCSAIAQCLPAEAPISKLKFSACVDPIITRLRDLARPNILICGIEAHVCIQQTVLDLLRLNYRPVICADATSARRPLDRDTALQRMRQAGAIITTAESAIFELLGEAGTEAFKKVLKVIK